MYSDYNYLLTCVDVFLLLIKMVFKLSQTNKRPVKLAKVVHSELQKFLDSSLNHADQKSISLALPDFEATPISVWRKCHITNWLKSHTFFGGNEKIIGAKVI